MDNIGNTSGSDSRKARAIPVLFTLTIFLSASLLFFVQPLFTKIALPQVGGTPAVWTTAMLFFQTVLIAGYAYAHFSTRYLPVIWQLGVHLALWAGALFFLPLSIRTGLSFEGDTSVTWQTLTLFAMGVGMPFAVLSANAPLIQSWYAKSGGASADDPYFLYGASNLGSLGALLAFPLVAEPLFGAAQIGWGWAAGFVALGFFLLTSGLAAMTGRSQQTTATETRARRPALRDIGFWLFLAFIPSSLMLAVTSKISRDVGSFPLIWVLPLAMYLLTFVLTFTNRSLISKNGFQWMLVFGIGFLGYFLTTSANTLAWWSVALLLLAFFAIAMVAHKALYDVRPDKSSLTLFYVVMSVGGALGGLFNSIIAPVVFSDLYETRITVMLAAGLFLIGRGWPGRRDMTIDVAIAAVVVTPLVVAGAFLSADAIQTSYKVVAVLFALAIVGAHVAKRTVILTIISVLILGGLAQGNALIKDRSFFGTHRVVEIDGQRSYVNGTTLHGSQFVADFQSGRPTPLTYYHEAAPLGQIMGSAFAHDAIDIGVVGLGVGSLACYAQPGQSWQFYEIDALVDRYARDPSLFTFMSTCAGDAPTHLGDARIVLEQQTDVKYDILVIDAFASDAIPVHLTTIEAIRIFRDRLKPDGLLVFHISNRYYEVWRPLARSAALLGLQARFQHFENTEKLEGASASQVVIMARDVATLVGFDGNGLWQALPSDGKPAWTDDFANVLSILR